MPFEADLPTTEWNRGRRIATVGNLSESPLQLRKLVIGHYPCKCRECRWKRMWTRQRSLPGCGDQWELFPLLAFFWQSLHHLPPPLSLAFRAFVQVVHCQIVVVNCDEGRRHPRHGTSRAHTITSSANHHLLAVYVSSPTPSDHLFKENKRKREGKQLLL